MTSNISSPAGGQSPLIPSADTTNTAQPPVVAIATKARDKAQAVVQSAADTVNQNRDTAAQLMTNAASLLRVGPTKRPDGDGVAKLAEATARGIDATARYVREHDTHQMLADLRRVVTRHPGASVVGAAVVGIVVGRGFRR